MQHCRVPHSSHIVSYTFIMFITHNSLKRLLVEILDKSILDYVCNGIKMSRSL